MRALLALVVALCVSHTGATAATLTLNEAEGQALLRLLDFAVRSEGLIVAESALVLAKKVEAAFAAEQEAAEEAEQGGEKE